MHQYPKIPGDAARRSWGDKPGAYVVTALWLGATLWLCVMLSAIGTGADRSPVAAAPARAIFEPSRFILNALLVPALDAEAVPLRWVDPRPASHCGPGSTVHVDGKPLRAGALVPVAPFELEWDTNGCRPFGESGPRFDGRIRLTVFREDWGFSAVVEPLGLCVVTTDTEITPIEQGAASMPQSVEDDLPIESVGMGPDQSQP